MKISSNRLEPLKRKQTMSKRLTTEEFIIKANSVHNNKYDYSLVEYVNNHTKVKIICKEHGVFEQIPNSHLLGRGCSRCSAELRNDSLRMTKGEFLERANKIYGDKYTYNLCNFENSHSKIEIICPAHGSFFMVAFSHLAGYACKTCKGRSFDKSSFVEKSSKLHEDRYDYSLVEYKNALTKVKILCKKHGLFSITPNSHLNGCGCPKCGVISRSNIQRSTNEEFIEKARKIHSDKYDYSLVDYKNTDTKVKIICSRHGTFEQTPYNHLKGCGCPACVGVALDTNIFIERSQFIHKDKYSYEKSNYVNSETNIEIICPIHGSFYQKPIVHMSGYGCPMCKTLNLIKRNTKTQESFIRRATQKYGSLYSYEHVIYRRCDRKVKITCRKHGDFEVTPTNFLHDSQCPRCSATKGERNILGFLNTHNVYFVFQYRIKNCRDKKPLPFDFAIFEDEEKTKLKCLVEYDGEQHFSSSYIHYKTSEDFSDRKRKDQIKTDYCLKNGIKLIRIPHWEFNNIENILNKELYKYE